MAYTTELTEDYMGIIHVGTGVVTGGDLIEACRCTTQLCQITANFHYEFIDFSETTDLQLTPEELEKIVAQDHYLATFRPDAVIVIVAPRDDLFATAKHWEQLVQDIGWKTHIARERGEALSWLKQNYPRPQIAPAPSEHEA